MGAPENNNFYLYRSKHGRNKNFKTPESVWQSFVEYVELVSKEDIKRQESHVKEGKIDISVPRPFTKEGFCNFVNITTQTFDNYKSKDGYNDFFDVFTRIEEICFLQNYELAITGVHKDGLAARKLGIRDKKDLTSDGKEIAPVIIDWNGTIENE